jgi:hypothetical protein
MTAYSYEQSRIRAGPLFQHIDRISQPPWAEIFDPHHPDPDNRLPPTVHTHDPEPEILP